MDPIMEINDKNKPLVKINNDVTNSIKQMNFSDPYVIRLWHRIPVIIQAIILGALICEIGIIAWLVTIGFIPAPWSIFVMILVFWVYWKYFSGSWGPKSTVEARKLSFRSVNMSTSVWKWGLAAALLLVVIVQSGLILTFRIIDFPAETFTAFDYDPFPLWFVVVFIIMAALEAGIFEEVGFRGYMQAPLEKRYGPLVGITIVSIMFVVLHLHQAWAPPVLIHLFVIGVLFGILAYTSGSLIPGIISHVIIDIFSWSYWWSGIAGKFEMRTIFETGIDIHFILWVIIFGMSTTLFLWAAYKLTTVRQQTTEQQILAKNQKTLKESVPQIY
jgi:membrane protease YdiL (CAAX protease family)